MKVRKHIPNTLTCFNLISGLMGLYFLMKGNTALASLMVFSAALFDFLDGFAARLLNVRSETGKELDSLADVVSFGVLPGFLLHRFVQHSVLGYTGGIAFWVSFVPFLVPVFAALRLARFNTDATQTEQFRGLPTPAAGLLVASLDAPGGLAVQVSGLPLADYLFHPLTLLALSLILCVLMVSGLTMFSLKISRLSLKQYPRQFVLIFLSIALILTFQTAGIGMTIVAYVLLSMGMKPRELPS